MKNRRQAFLIGIVVLALLGIWAGCQTKSKIATTQEPDFTLNYHVEEAPEWTDLFYRKTGWFGGDGIFSIGLDGNDQNSGSENTLLIFSDTYIGTVEDNAPLPGNVMINNSVAYVRSLDPDPSEIDFHFKTDQQNNPATFFVPTTGESASDQHYWLGDGFVHRELDNQLYLFAYHIEITGPNVFDFIEPDVSLLALPPGSKPPFSDQRQIATPLHIKHDALGEGNFGAGILVNTSWADAPNPDEYIYTYACLGQDKNLIAARVASAKFENFKDWRFWDGKSWGKDINAVAPITNSVSNELSVTPLPDGRYILVFQVLGISDKVGIRIGHSPIGPFGPIEEIYRTPEIDEGLLPYNAKAHPALSKRGELLISYNTITFDFWNDIQKNAHIYRPRFIKLFFDQ